MPRIEAASFFDIAHDAVNADAPIETTDNNIHVADSSTDQSINHACMQNFLQALKRSYGSAFAAATALTFQAEIAASKPLTVRMVQEVQDLSRIYVVQQNANCRALFSAGLRPEASLDSIMDEALGTQAHGLDTEVREVLRTAVEASITERFDKQDESLLTMDTLKQYVSRNPILSAAQELLSGGTALSHLPGSMMDKMFIVGALASSPCAMAFALHKLESIRNTCLQGELSVQNIWEGCFAEHMPPLTESFTDAFGKKAIEVLEAKVPGKSGILEMLLFSIPLEKALEILQSPPSHLDEKVLLAPSCSLALGSSVNYTEEEVMARDILHRGESAQTIQGTIATSPPSIIVGGQHYTVGKSTDFVFSNKEDETAYRQGRPSSFSRKLIQEFTALCDAPNASPRQVQTLTRLCSQAPMRNVLGGGCGCFKGIFQTQLNEHSPTQITMTKGENGQVLVNIQTSHDPNISGATGTVNMSYVVPPDGSSIPTSVLLTPPRGTIEGLRPAAQDIRAGILQARHAGVSRKEITQNMRMAFNANTISKAELTLLQALLMETEGPALSDKAQSLLQSNLAELMKNPNTLLNMEKALIEYRNSGYITGLEQQTIHEELERYQSAASLRFNLPDMLKNKVEPQQIRQMLDDEVNSKRILPEQRDAIMREASDPSTARRSTPPTPSQAFTYINGLINLGCSRDIVTTAIEQAQKKATLNPAEVSTLQQRKANMDNITEARPNVSANIQSTHWTNRTHLHPNGVCEAAVSLWLKAIHEKGIDEAVKILPSDCDTLQDEVEAGRWTFSLNLAALLAGSAEVSNLDNVITVKEEGNNLVSPEELLKAMTPGSFHFLSATTKNGNGHAMGVYCKSDGNMCFFDPNYSIYTGSREDITQQILSNISIWPTVTCLKGKFI